MRPLTAMILAAAALASLGGCSTWRAYPGEGRPSADVAIVDVPAAGEHAGVKRVIEARLRKNRVLAAAAAFRRYARA